jgi:hypothetical protein
VRERAFEPFFKTKNKKKRTLNLQAYRFMDSRRRFAICEILSFQTCQGISMICRDTSCRPHEILNARISNVTFKNEGNYQYAEIFVNGKTGSRPLPLINSIPYVKDYLDHEHPQPTNPNSPLICGTGRGLGRHISTLRFYKIYDEYKKEIFPKLLESPNVLPEDKQKINDLLETFVDETPLQYTFRTITSYGLIASYEPNLDTCMSYDACLERKDNFCILSAVLQAITY